MCLYLSSQSQLSFVCLYVDCAGWVGDPAPTRQVGWIAAVLARWQEPGQMIVIIMIMRIIVIIMIIVIIDNGGGGGEDTNWSNGAGGVGDLADGDDNDSADVVNK